MMGAMDLGTQADRGGTLQGLPGLVGSVFRGRRDVYARWWVSKDGSFSGYAPACKNEWCEGKCQKGTGVVRPCVQCDHADYIPLTEEVLQAHLHGLCIVGIYPLLLDGTCHFVAADFDDHAAGEEGARDPQSDVTRYAQACELQGLPCYVLRSRSGKGFHAYLFFEVPVPAWKARTVAFALLQEAGVVRQDANLSSFDRLFPNQDRLTGKRLGNLIALPFQAEARRHGHTLLLDPATGYAAPYEDQGGALESVQRVSEAQLDTLIEDWSLKPGSTRPEQPSGKRVDPASVLAGVSEGERDETLFKYAASLRARGVRREEAEVLVLLAARNCTPPFPEAHARQKIAGVWDRYDGPTQGEQMADGWDEGEESAVPIPQFPVDVFPAPLARAVQEVAEAHCLPVEIPACALLATAGACIGRTRGLQIKPGWTEHANLWLGIVAVSGTGKSPGVRAIMRPVHDAETRWAREYRAAMDEYQARVDARNALPKRDRGDVPMPDPPQRTELLIDDATLESLTQALDANPRGILWCRDELAGLILDLDRYVERQGGTKARLMSSYDSGPWKVSRVGKQAYVPHACVSIFGTIQPAALPDIFSAQDSLTGFLPRFLFCTVRRDGPVQWTDWTVSQESQRCLEETLRGLLALDFDQDGAYREVRPSPEAKSIFVDWFNRQAALPWVDPSMEEFEAVLTKLRGQCLRLALVLHGLGDRDGHIVSADTMTRACTLAYYFQAHARSAWATVQGKSTRELTPVQGRVAVAILALVSEVEGGRLPVSRISDVVNDGVDDRFRLSAETVGWACKSLGLAKAKTPDGAGRAVSLNQGAVEGLKNRTSIQKRTVRTVRTVRSGGPDRQSPDGLDGLDGLFTGEILL